ncbi:MAG: replication-associated recombination protein A [Deltaproteobacteria bacterium]|nr:replication-associated recombination protein A [Deltaproteobacteria bacterium]
MDDLFKDIDETPHAKKTSSSMPLAERMRATTIDDYVGQEHILGTGKFLRNIIDNGDLPSLILWGPPGTGKTTLARIIASSSSFSLDDKDNCKPTIFKSFSAVLSGVKDIRQVITEAKKNLAIGIKTVLFVDEIHRFNKSQQDAFLHHVEDGTITLIGATTENPSFELNAPLLSRCKVLTLNPLSTENILTILRRAVSKEGFEAEGEVLDFIAAFSHGDARAALNTLEASAMVAPKGADNTRRLTIESVKESLQRTNLRYDKAGEEHYNVVSAFIKSMRASKADASLYWLARMILGGEDHLFIARRMVIFASEDIGNANPSALALAVSVKEAVAFVGRAEGWIALAQGVTYLADSAKSNASYKAYKLAAEDVERSGALAVPMHLRNAPTTLMKDIGYGDNYKYPHDHDESEITAEYMPDEISGRRYYTSPKSPRSTKPKEEESER